LTVSVPAEARVFVNGRTTTSTGSVRQYVSPGLVDGLDYLYKVRAEINRDGRLVSQTRIVRVRAGEATNVDFDLKPLDLEPSGEVQTALTLHVPQDATVVLVGEETTATGTVRTYRTAALDARQTWSGYTVQVSVVRNGRQISEEKTIDLVGGQQTSLAFTFGDEHVASR
jgi:uncharacterized protein (TIGR03000 family)